jgi:hypothetical protein
LFFKFSCDIVGLRDHLKNTEDIEFHFNLPLAATIRVGKKFPDGLQPSDPSAAFCAGTTSGEIEDDQCAAEINAALSSSLDGKCANFRGVESARTPLMFSAIDRFFGPLRTLIGSTITVLRWRSGLSEGLTDPFRNRKEYLSVDGGDWLEVPTVRSLKITFHPPLRHITASPQLETDVVGLVSSGNEEPLGHQLFREAWNQRDSHPRSALVIGVAAAEVGLKKLIGTLVPQAQWLVDEIQTPSFGKMLRKYIPSLEVKAKFQGKTVAPPSRLISKLEKAVEYRNKVVHAGKAPPQHEELEQILRTVDDFLWICDAYAGHLWVSSYISAETQAAWKNE